MLLSNVRNIDDCEIPGDSLIYVEYPKKNNQLIPTTQQKNTVQYSTIPDFLNKLNTSIDRKKQTAEITKKGKREFKKIVLSAINLLIHCETLDDAAKICEHILIVFGFPNESEDYTEALHALKMTDNIAKPSDLEESIDDEKKENGDLADDKCTYYYCHENSEDVRNIKESPFFIFFNEIRQNVSQNIVISDFPNRFCSKKFIKYLFDFFLPYIPLCSAIILNRLGIR